MAAYKKGTQSLETRKRNSSVPAIGTNITIRESNGSSPSQLPAIGQSYNKMIGGSTLGGGLSSRGGFSGGLPSMGQLEASSMRLADAASRRDIAEKEAEKNLEAMEMGYDSLEDMQSEAKNSRLEKEREDKKKKEYEEMKRRGFVWGPKGWSQPLR